MKVMQKDANLAKTAPVDVKIIGLKSKRIVKEKKINEKKKL